jgi:hypothetical protein
VYQFKRMSLRLPLRLVYQFIPREVYPASASDL